jgi:hypothetical protein
MVDGKSDALALEGFSITIVVELGGKYKGIHPHLRLHHFMLHLIASTRVC